ncbi:transcription initiation factor IIF, beta subunit-domain-containing protein [Dichotomocladium elegans]|nr:transcription initiation factor IIF, beta subunit-domain-containing protein [Dichotomocladium elegans]
MSTNPDVDALFEDDHGPIETIDDDDDDDLKLDSADTKVWLVKVPKFLAEKWRAVDQDNVNLGSIRIYSEPPPGRSSAISLVLPENEQSNIIKEYMIHIPPAEVTNKFVFTESENGGKSAAKMISGTVHHECTATPTQMDQYRGIMRKRVRDAETPNRSVQEFERNGSSLFVPGASSSLANTGFSDFTPAKKPKTDNKEKATRMPRNELMDKLFTAFERYPYWSFKGLLEHTKQPSQYLKEVLSEICILNKRGPYASNYQLKPEYKQRPSEAEQANTGGNDSGTPSSDEEDEDEEEEMETIRV